MTTSNGYWQFDASGYSISSGTFKSRRINAVADTGTTLTLVPDTIIKEYYAKVQGVTKDEGLYVFPCDAKLPSFTFGVGAARITIPSSYLRFVYDDSGKRCAGGLQSSGGVGHAIFGDVSLKAAFVVFDAGNLQLGWANKPLAA